MFIPKITPFESDFTYCRKDPPETECFMRSLLPDPPVGPSVQTLAAQLKMIQTQSTLFFFLSIVESQKLKEKQNKTQESEVR